MSAIASIFYYFSQIAWQRQRQRQYPPRQFADAQAVCPARNAFHHGLVIPRNNLLTPSSTFRACCRLNKLVCCYPPHPQPLLPRTRFVLPNVPHLHTHNTSSQPEFCSGGTAVANTLCNPPSTAPGHLRWYKTITHVERKFSPVLFIRSLAVCSLDCASVCFLVRLRWSGSTLS